MSRFCPKPCERYGVWTIAPEENCTRRIELN